MADPRKKWKFSISKERTALLICMGFAFLMWIFLKLSNEYDTTRNIYLTYRLPPLMEFVENPPDELEAVVSGRGLDLASKYLFKNRPTILIDISDNEHLEMERNELIRKIEEVLSLNVIDIDRNYLFFRIDSMANKKVPVRVNLSLEFKRDFYLKDSIQISHDSVIVSGGQSEIEKIDFVTTERMSFGNIDKSIEKEIILQAENFQNIKILPEKLEVYIPVEQFTEKSFDIPVTVSNIADSISIIPSHVKLNCIVGLSRYESLSADQFVVEADLERGTEPGHHNSVPVVLQESPPWVRSVQVYPKSVEYLIIR